MKVHTFIIQENGNRLSFYEIELEDLVPFPPCPDPPCRTPLPAIATPELL